MASHIASCYTPGTFNDPIAGLGGHDWWASSEDIIRAINSEQHDFWIIFDGGEEVRVVVKELGMGRSTLTTAGDTYSSRPSVLLGLPECQRTEF
ncbi:MAG: hypothetical protein HOP96_00365 [Sphingomonas sp.]|nr:hypothetical protein [Sphingomonas sp.]